MRKTKVALALLFGVVWSMTALVYARTCDWWDWPKTDEVPAWWCDEANTFTAGEWEGSYPSWPLWRPRPFAMHRVFETWPEPGTYEIELLWIIRFNDADDPVGWIPPLHWNQSHDYHGCPDPPDWPDDWGWWSPRSWRTGSYWLDVGDEQYELWHCGWQNDPTWGAWHDYDYLAVYWFKGEVTFADDAPVMHIDIRLPGYVTPDYREVYTWDECRMRIVSSPKTLPEDILNNPGDGILADYSYDETRKARKKPPKRAGQQIPEIYGPFGPIMPEPTEIEITLPEPHVWDSSQEVE